MTREDAKSLVFTKQEPLDADEFEFAVESGTVNKIINIIYDDFESRTCESCKHYNDFNESSGLCENVESKMTGVDNDDGCNKWKQK